MPDAPLCHLDPAVLAFLDDLPTLHHWGGRPQVGGLDRRIARRIATALAGLERAVVVETGAGATTLLFLLLGVERLTSIAPDDGLHQRVLATAIERGIDVDGLDVVVDRSERALPTMAASGARVDVALIDGNHGWPAVFVDFCYLNVMLRRDGILFLDDVQLHSVAQLFLLLRHQPEYELVALEGKFATFVKRTAEPYLPDWAGQPFIRTSSVR